MFHQVFYFSQIYFSLFYLKIVGCTLKTCLLLSHITLFWVLVFSYRANYVCQICILIFVKIIGGRKSFLWDNWYPVLNFWWCLSLVPKPEWAALFALDRGVCVTHSPRSISCVPPAYLLVASMATEPFSSTYPQAGNGGAQNQDLSYCRQNVLPTAELCILIV